MKNRTYFSLFTLPGIMLLILMAAGSCKTVKQQPSFTAPAWQQGNEAAMMADSLGGYVFFPGTKVLARTTFSADTITTEIRTSDTLSLRSLLVNGVSLFFDPTGKQEPKFGIAFPAARSEMLRRQDEFLIINPGDSIRRIPPFNTAMWVQTVQSRKAVLTDKQGTRFAEDGSASVFLENNELVYRVKLAFSQIDTAILQQQRISVGIFSEVHQAVNTSSQGGGGIATRPNIGDNERRPPAASRQPMMRMRQIPVKGWILFQLHQGGVAPAQEKSKRNGDDVYFNPEK
jgi:hypothetical protein